jgi:hypothetical protein
MSFRMFLLVLAGLFVFIFVIAWAVSPPPLD